MEKDIEKMAPFILSPRRISTISNYKCIKAPEQFFDPVYPKAIPGAANSSPTCSSRTCPSISSSSDAEDVESSQKRCHNARSMLAPKRISSPKIYLIVENYVDTDIALAQRLLSQTRTFQNIQLM